MNLSDEEYLRLVKESIRKVNMASLNREEWEKMWNSIKMIEHFFTSKRNKHVSDAIQFIKDKIQEVIGQME